MRVIGRTGLHALVTMAWLSSAAVAAAPVPSGTAPPPASTPPPATSTAAPPAAAAPTAPATTSTTPAAAAPAPAAPAPTAAPPPGGPELDAPQQIVDRAAPPRIVEDRARVADAPTAAAISAALTENDVSGARALAEKALASSRIAYGTGDVRTVVPLINLATVKERSGDLPGALADYHRAVSLGELKAGPRDARLFDGWYGIGVANLEAGNYLEAMDALGNALQLHRINNGLYSDGQLDVLHALAMTSSALARVPDAIEFEKRRNDVAERVHGIGRPELAPLYASVGRFLRDVGDIQDAANLHNYSLAMLERTWGKDDPRLFPYLLEFARTVALIPLSPDAPLIPGAQPATLLKRAQAIAENEAFGSPEKRARALLVVGDAMFLCARRDQALPIYAKVADQFAALKLPPPFGQPAFLVLNAPGLVAGRRIQPGDGFVLAQFTSDAKGRARDIEVVQVQPASVPKEQSDALVSALKRAQLRPRIVDGKPVDTQGVRFRLPVRGDSG